ncbi:MAG: hypothetical protein NW203_06990 [Hyphomonadaceae bacterium]|nr:hypothetical protein [Hyphomonadaceae bacterium]
MAARRPNLPSAVADLGFAIAAGVLGGMGAPFLAFGALALAHAGLWAYTRRATLAATPANHRPGVIAVSLGLIAAVDAGAYYIGLSLGGGA